MSNSSREDNDSSVARLIRLAGARNMPSNDAMERARVAAAAAWERGLKNGEAPSQPARSARFMWWPLAIAASCALVAILVFNRPAPPATPALRAVAEVVTADVPSRIRLASGETLTAGMQLYEGADVDTGEGRTAILLGHSLSLRADRHTRFEIIAADRVRLLEGQIYVDSGVVPTVSRLQIETPAGEVRHLGTQFLVSVERYLTRIRVREGRVALTRSDATTHDIAAGDALEVTADRVQRLHNQPSYGKPWEWAAATAPMFDIEDRSLTEFLAWIAREHGWQIRYRDELTQLQAQKIRLHGSVSGLAVDAMLERVALITGMALHVEEGVLSVGNEAVL